MRNTKKITGIIPGLFVLTLLMLTLTACMRAEFSMGDTTEKRLTINTKNAGKNDYIMGGSLEVADGEQIVIDSGLTKGSVLVELFRDPDEQSIDELPEIESDATLSEVVSATEGDNSNTSTLAAQVPAGSYTMKATCVEMATGTILIEVKP